MMADEPVLMHKSCSVCDLPLDGTEAGCQCSRPRSDDERDAGGGST